MVLRVAVFETEQVAQLVRHDGQQVHAALLTLVAGRRELGVLPRRRIDEPAPAGGVDEAAVGLCKEVGALLAG